ncbi:hypothetical protein DFJ77DRAFT_508325 [Powellomyces hirtus]|nr:hypothetical protein DFJ77DRAFT_508325 [Powellomyces hirtus]
MSLRSFESFDMQLRDSPEWSSSKKECTLFASVAGICTGVAGLILTKRVAPHRNSVAIGGISAAAMSAMVYSSMESSRFKDLRVRKVAEHYERMKPIFAPVIEKSK